MFKFGSYWIRLMLYVGLSQCFMSGCKRRQNLTFSHNKLLNVVILVNDEFWNEKFCTLDFFKNIKKWLQYKKFLLYVHKDQRYSTKIRGKVQKVVG